MRNMIEAWKSLRSHFSGKWLVDMERQYNGYMMARPNSSRQKKLYAALERKIFVMEKHWVKAEAMVQELLEADPILEGSELARVARENCAESATFLRTFGLALGLKLA
jgi:hypothetical protein